MSDEKEYPDNSANVLAFTKRFNENSDIKEMRNFVEAPVKESRYCQHQKIYVDAHLRQLTCRLCGAVVDAFDWINSVTKGETKIDWELTQLRAEIKEHREGLEKLKREELNCRARIKNAMFKKGDIERELSFLEDALLTKKLN